MRQVVDFLVPFAHSRLKASFLLGRSALDFAITCDSPLTPLSQVSFSSSLPYLLHYLHNSALIPHPISGLKLQVGVFRKVMEIYIFATNDI